MQTKSAAKRSAKTLRERAEDLLRKKGRSHKEAEVSAVLHELQVHQAELEVQNQELRRTQSELEASRNRYFGLFDLAPLPYLVFDDQHRLSDINLAAVELVGVERGRLKGNPFFTHIAVDHRNLFHKHLNAVFNDSTSQVLECILQTRSRGHRWVRFHSQKLPAESGARQLCLAAAVDFTERRSVEEALRRSEAELEAVYNNALIMMCLVNEQQEIELMNRAMSELLGISNFPEPAPAPAPERVLKPLARGGNRPPPVHQEKIIGCFNALHRNAGCGKGAQCDRCPLRMAMAETFRTGRSYRQLEGTLCIAREGVWKELDVSASTILIKVEGKSRVLVCLEDITGRKQLQAQLMQAQKMEAIGQLAGGVAHDFNNILAAAMMNITMLKTTYGASTEAQTLLRELERGTERAASLTRQLLLFGRRQMMETQHLNLNEVVARMLNMLRRVLGEHIDIRWDPHPQPLWVEGDSGMLDQVVMNLCVNSRDAMPKGGMLSLSNKRADLDAAQALRHEDARPGKFACLTVTDTGVGMDSGTLKRIFEPFFTTKEMGKGTGLGLATVYGIVRQHQGWIEVESTPSLGTSFRIFLPESAQAAVPPEPETHGEVRGGGETILLVEDDEVLRRLIAQQLRETGYQVIEAANGLEAIRRWDQHAGAVDLLFTDMVMPKGMTGLDVVEKLRSLKPGLKAIISSGYSLDLAHPDGKPDPTIRFLPKPYPPSALARLLRDCFDEVRAI